MIQGLLGAPLACGLVLATLGALLWHHEHHFQRFTLWLFTAASACLFVGTPTLTAALAGEVSSGPGLTGLLIATVVFGTTWWLVAIRTHRKSRLAGLTSFLPGKMKSITNGGAPRPDRYRRIGSPLVAVIAGVIFVLVYGMWRQLLRSASSSAGNAVRDLLQSSHRISTGKAAASVQSSQRPEIIFIAVGVLVVIWFIMRSHEKRRNGGAGGGRGGHRALGGGN